MCVRSSRERWRPYQGPEGYLWEEGSGFSFWGGGLLVFFFKLEERDLMVFMGGGKQPVGRDRLTAAQVGKVGPSPSSQTSRVPGMTFCCRPPSHFSPIKYNIRSKRESCV